MEMRRQSSKANLMEKTELVSSSSAVDIVSATKKKMKVLKDNAVSSLDRVNFFDRCALFVVGTVAQVLGHSVKDLSLSFSIICRTRR